MCTQVSLYYESIDEIDSSCDVYSSNLDSLVSMQVFLVFVFGSERNERNAQRKS
jgi:hypothetical protein